MDERGLLCPICSNNSNNQRWANCGAEALKKDKQSKKLQRVILQDVEDEV